MLKGGPIVVGDIPQEKRPPSRDGSDLLRDDGEAVAVRLVLGAVPQDGIAVRPVNQAADVSLQSFRMN